MTDKTTRRLMGIMTSITTLRIGISRNRKTRQIRYFVRSASTGRRYPAFLGLLSWMLQIPLIMGVILTALAVPSALVEGKGIVFTIGLAAICVACAKATLFLNNLWEKQPGWDCEDYIPSQQELAEWNLYVHSEDEYYFIEQYRR